jgi:hypothetical protein
MNCAAASMPKTGAWGIGHRALLDDELHSVVVLQSISLVSSRERSLDNVRSCHSCGLLAS